MINNRLFIFTGKGGVGKTSLAIAKCLELKKQGKVVFYNSFDVEAPGICEALEIPYLNKSLEESATSYIGKRLGSKAIASWVMKTAFFRSLFHMVPSLGQLIILGSLIHELEDQPELHLVVDSPASGHAKSMFESTFNFKKIFKTGFLATDIDKMIGLLRDPSFLKVYLVSLATPMSIQETRELESYLRELEIPNVELIVNNSFATNKSLSSSMVTLPEFLMSKIAAEREILKDLSEYEVIPYIETLDQRLLIEKISEHLGGKHGA